MPWKIVKQGDEWCVYKHDADGNPIGETEGCSATEDEAKAHMAALYASEDKEQAQKGNGLDWDGFGVTRAEITSGAFGGEDVTAQALALINEKHAKTPLTGADVYLFRAEMSNGNLDSYFTRMADSSLRNYKRDAQAGVPLMNSHKTGAYRPEIELPVGRSYWADLLPGADGSRLLVDHYILRGWSNGSVQSDDLIRGIEGGVIHDASIGFGGGAWWRCSICNANMLRSEKCKHLPGLRYDVEGKETLASAWVEDASLIEDSLVYRGATPNAGILRKAVDALREGTVALAQVRQLEEQYHVRILERTFYSVPAAATDPAEGKDMEIEQVRAAFPGVAGVESAETVEAVFEIVNARIAKLDDFTLEQDRHLKERIAEVETLKAQIAALELRAKRGDAWLADLIEQTVKARVRVQGNDFDGVQYRAKLAEQGDPEYVKGELAAWEKLAAGIYTAGRQIGKPPAPELKRNPAQYGA